MRFGERLGVGLLLCMTSSAMAAKDFDASRDPAADLAAAKSQARSEHKNILLDVGGDWCPWCLLLNRTLRDDSELHGLLDRNFVVVRVNWSRENENMAFLAHYPKANGYPAWYVLSPDGRLLKAEDTSELEADHKLGSGYNKASVASFLRDNAPKATSRPVG